MRFQFTIRSALLFTAAVAVLLAIRQSTARRYESQRLAAEKLLAVGAAVAVEPIRPAPLRWLVADDDLGPVTTVRLEGCLEPGDSLVALADLPDLERLYLPNSAVTDDDLRHIAGLTKLRRLALWRTRITARGFRHLEGLENLELLDIHGSGVSEEALPHLARLPRLRQIVTTMTLSDRGLACLRTFVHHPRIIRGRLVVEGISDQGMADLGTLGWIKELTIRDSSISARGYAELARLKHLGRLKVSGTGCDDEALVQIRRIGSLRSLSVYDRPPQISLGGIMRCWGGQISWMKVLLTPGRRNLEFSAREVDSVSSVSANFATADVESLAICRNCRSLCLRSDTLDEEILAAVGQMTNLEYLGLLYTDGRHWEGPAPGPRPDLTGASEHLAGLTRLERLSLRCWSLGDDQLSFLINLPALEHLELFRIPISGVGFRHVRETSRLRRVDVGKCAEFNDDGLAELLRLENLERVYLVETGVKAHPYRATVKR